MFPLVPGCIPHEGQHARIKRDFEFSTQVAIKGPIAIELTTPEWSPEMSMPLFWQKAEDAFGEECIAGSGPFTHDQDRAETAVRKDGRCLRIFQ